MLENPSKINIKFLTATGSQPMEINTRMKAILNTAILSSARKRFLEKICLVMDLLAAPDEIVR